MGQLSGPLDRLTSLCVLASTPGIDNGPAKCCVVAGLLVEGGIPCLAVYDIVWKSAGHQQGENGPRTSLSDHPGPSSSGTGGTVKKGGTTKKVSSTPHILAPNFGSG